MPGCGRLPRDESIEVTICAGCAAVNHDHARFCGTCGLPLSTPSDDAASTPPLAAQTAAAARGPATTQRLQGLQGLGAPTGLLPQGSQALSAYLDDLGRWRLDSLVVGGRIATLGVASLIALSFLAAFGISLVVDPDPGFRLQEWFRGGVALSALALGGSVGGTYAGEEDTAVRVSGMPLLLTALFVLTAAVLARRCVTAAPAGALHRGQVAITAAVAFAVLHSAVTLAARGPLGSAASGSELNGLEVDAFSWRGFLTAVVLVGVTTVAALPRALARDGGLLAAGPSADLRRTLRHALGQIAAIATLGAAATVVYYVREVDGVVDQVTDGRFLVVALLVLPSLVLSAGSLLSGATFEGGLLLEGVVEPGAGVLAGGATRYVWIGVLCVALTSLLVGLRNAYREPPGVRRLDRVWLTLAAAASCWFVISRLVALSWSAEGDVDELFSSLGIGTPSMLVLGAFWTASGLVLGRLGARLAAASFPRTARLLAGRRADALWLELLDERRRAPETASGTRLGAGRPLALASVVVLPVVAFLLLLPSSGLMGRSNAVSATFAGQVPVPSATAPVERRERWASEETEIARIEAEAERADSAAEPARSAIAALGALNAQIAAARDEMDGQRRALTEAEEEVESEQSVVAGLEAAVSEAREYYDMYSEYDTEGFWLDRLNDARAALAEGRQPLDAAIRARTVATQRMEQLSAELDGLQVRQAAGAVRADQRSLINAADDAKRLLRQARTALDDDQDAWAKEISARREGAVEANAVARDARRHGATRSVPASLLLLALLAFAFTRRRRRRRAPTAALFQGAGGAPSPPGTAQPPHAEPNFAGPKEMK